MSSIKEALAKIIRGRCVNTSGTKTFLDRYINEEKIRASGKDFGLVMVSASAHKLYEHMLEDIPEGYLVDFIMASAILPIFKAQRIEEMRFLVGAIYSNCPVNLLTEKGYDEIIAVRTRASGVIRKMDDPAITTVIAPSGNLGSLVRFTRENSEENIKRGFLDGLRVLDRVKEVV